MQTTINFDAPPATGLVIRRKHRTAHPERLTEAEREEIVPPHPSEVAVHYIIGRITAGADEFICECAKRWARDRDWPNWTGSRIRDARLVLQRAGYVELAIDGDGLPLVGETEHKGACRVWKLV